MKAVHVCEETIRKRLGEFKSTNTAKLTRHELKEIEDKDSDPYKFFVEEKDFEPPSITKKEFMKSFAIKDSEANAVEKDLHQMMAQTKEKIDKRLQVVSDSTANLGDQTASEL